MHLQSSSWPDIPARQLSQRFVRQRGKSVERRLVPPEALNRQSNGTGKVDSTAHKFHTGRISVQGN
jgi:hypothetical protein